MSIGAHLHKFYGLHVFEFPESPKAVVPEGGYPAPESVAWRLSIDPYDGDGTWDEMFARFLATVDTSRVRALVLGTWLDAMEDSPEQLIRSLVEAKDQLPDLRAVFVADIVMEEAEISWITQGDVTPLLNAFPRLEMLGIRGGNGLVFSPVRHEGLRELRIETGGLPAGVVRGIAASDLPSLVHLELWLGTSEYGGDSEIADLAPILAGTRLPSLKYLALCNSEMQDDICAALASAPVVARLDTLDVSMGVLTDEGAAALLTGQPLTHLTALDMNHNYLSPEMRERIQESLEAAGVEVDVDPDDAEAEEEEDGTVWRYVAVGE